MMIKYRGDIILLMGEAERKAWDSLSRYKFIMFGYHAAVWINFNRVLQPRHKRSNPFLALVKIARQHRQGEHA